VRHLQDFRFFDSLVRNQEVEGSNPFARKYFNGFRRFRVRPPKRPEIRSDAWCMPGPRHHRPPYSFSEEIGYRQRSGKQPLMAPQPTTGIRQSQSAGISLSRTAPSSSEMRRSHPRAIPLDNFTVLTGPASPFPRCEVPPIGMQHYFAA